MTIGEYNQLMADLDTEERCLNADIELAFSVNDQDKADEIMSKLMDLYAKRATLMGEHSLTRENFIHEAPERLQ